MASGTQSSVRSPQHSALLERFVDEHHRDIAHDRVDAAALDAPQTVFDHRLLEVAVRSHVIGEHAELVAHRGAPALRERHSLHFLLADGAGEDLEKFGIDRHGGAKCSISSA